MLLETYSHLVVHSQLLMSSAARLGRPEAVSWPARQVRGLLAEFLCICSIPKHCPALQLPGHLGSNNSMMHHNYVEPF